MVRSARVLALLLLLSTGTATPAAAGTPGTGTGTGTADVIDALTRADAESALWTGSWETAPSGTTAALPGAAIRNVVHLSIGGSAVRLRISNRLGTLPLRLDAVTVALRREAGADAVPGSMRVAAFAGEAAVVVPPGQDVVTDPVPLVVPDGADLLVTVRAPADSGPATYHRTALQTSYVAEDGARWAAAEDGAGYTTVTRQWYYVTGVDVQGDSAGSVVAFGDSLTDGNGSTSDANHRWPDRLAERLSQDGRRTGVLNAGVSGNRLLRDGVGPSALARLDADALSRAGVRALIVLEGVNDIKGSPAATDPAEFEAAYREIVRRAHALGIRVVGATITPYSGYSAYTEAAERVRQQVNARIRTGGVFDAVADFDAAVRDPALPERIRPEYDPGDHLHFNDAGMRTLADTVDLATL